MKKILQIYNTLEYKKDQKTLNLETNSITLEIYCTDSCNYNCHYCFNLRDGYHRKNKRINFNQVCNLIKWLYKKTKKHINVVLIGGEPTLHPDFFTFLQNTYKLQQNKILTIQVFTNFSQSEDFYLRSFEYNIEYIISFHYLTDKRANEFCTKLINLKNQSDKFEIHVMLDYLNFDKCINVFHRLFNYFKYDIVCDLLNDSNKSNLYSNRLNNYTYEQIKQYNDVCNIVNLYDKSTLAIDYKDKTTDIKSYLFVKNSQEINFKTWLCNAGKDFISIDFDGNIHPCFLMRHKTLANINNFITLDINKKTLCQTNECCNFNILKQNIFNK